MKMKKIAIFILTIFALNSCTNEFEAINTNKNQPTNAEPKFLLPSAIFDLANNTVSQAFGFGDIISQYGGDYEYNELDIYNWGSDNRFWDLYDFIENAKDIETQAIANGDKNYEAVALILESYMSSILTDSYGSVPFSEANNGINGNYMPKYDSQQEIYTIILSNLTYANSIIDVNTTIEGDILFNGNMLMWKKLCNSLHVRLLMRISNKENISERLTEIIYNPTLYPLFESNNDNAIYKYSGSFPDLSPRSAGIGREYEYHIVIPSTHFVNLLVENNDSRLNEWIDASADSNSYVGLEPGLPLDQIGEPINYARRSDAHFNDPTKISAIFMTYSELNFLLAEARERAIITLGTAQNYYNTAVQASFEQWGVNMPSSYLTETAQYNPSSDVLYEQKWLALYHTGVEAWFDWKRTGKPSFIKAGSGAQNNGLVPRRLLYPSLEQSINNASYQQAIESIGGDNINARVWWDNF